MPGKTLGPSVIIGRRAGVVVFQQSQRPPIILAASVSPVIPDRFQHQHNSGGAHLPGL